jgi:NAD(P)-dependent dehydrogenase (short-subunit alcohol dehydrogenase family)
MTHRYPKVQQIQPPAGSHRADIGDHPTRGSKNPTNGTIRSTVVVLGATSAVGQGAVRAALSSGRRVVAVGGDRAELAALLAPHPGGAELTTHLAAIANDADAVRLAASLRSDDRPLEAVIDAMPAGAGRGRLIDQPTDVLRETLAADLLPHLSAARHLIPLLAETKRGGSYVLIGGPGSEAAWLNYGCRSVAAAALRMLANVLHDEAQSLDVRVQMLLVETPVRGETSPASQCPQWPSGDAVGKQALRLIDREVATKPARPVVRFARPAVDDVGGVESATDGTTTRQSLFPDVPTFLKTLISDDRNEVFPDETP